MSYVNNLENKFLHECSSQDEEVFIEDYIISQITNKNYVAEHISLNI